MNKKKIIIIISILFLLMGGIIGYFTYKSMSPRDRFDEEFAAKRGMMPGKTQEEMQELLNQEVADGMMNIRINTDIILANGNDTGLVAIENTEKNHYSYSVEIRLKDSNTLLCKTGIIQPGFYIDTVRFDHDTVLKKGEYLAVATLTTYYPDTNEDVMGSTDVEINITVEN